MVLSISIRCAWAYGEVGTVGRIADQFPTTLPRMTRLMRHAEVKLFLMSMRMRMRIVSTNIFVSKEAS